MIIYSFNLINEIREILTGVHKITIDTAEHPIGMKECQTNI